MERERQKKGKGRKKTDLIKSEDVNVSAKPMNLHI